MMEKRRRITKTYFDIARHKYIPLICQLSLRISVDTKQIEELKARANEELLKCMICYNGSGSFMTFLYFRLVGVFRHMRDAEIRARRIQNISMDSIVNIVGPDYDIDFHMMAQEYLSCLNDEERYIITELFFNDKTMREVSDSHGVVPSTICRIKTRAMNKMRQKCEMEIK